MQIGDIKAFKRAVIAFFIVGAVLQLVSFGSYYLGRYGFSFPHGTDGLWWTFYQEAETSATAAITAASTIYLEAGRKKDESKTKVAA